MTPAPPPLLPHLLFESPLPLVFVLAAVTLTLMVIARRRNSHRLLLLAGGVSVAALVVVLLARYVTTQREVINQLTARLVAATAPLDEAKLNAMLHPDAQLLGPDGQLWLRGRQISERLTALAWVYPIQSQRVRSVATEMRNDTQAITALDLRTTLAHQVESTEPTTWLLTWEKQADGNWRVTSVQWVTWRGQSPVAGLLP